MDNVRTGRDPLFFGGETAVEYWRRASRRGVRPKPVAGITLKSAPDLKYLAESSYNVRAMANLRGMLHVYVSNTGCVPKGKFGVPFNVKLPDPRFAPHVRVPRCVAILIRIVVKPLPRRWSRIGFRRTRVSDRIASWPQAFTSHLQRSLFCNAPGACRCLR